MHQSAYDDAARFVETYLANDCELKIADVGSYDINGTLRPLFEHDGWKYTGIDSMAGPNVDVIVPSEADWAEVESEQFDLVVSTQTLEHIPKPWHWIRELRRICKRQGLIYICSPNSWGFHEYPVDCWRVWPDGMRALFDEADIIPIDVYAAGPDTTGIGRTGPAVSISIIVPTCGRTSLAATLESIHPQLAADDEVLIVADGPQPVAANIVASVADERLKYFEHGPTHFYGQAEMNHVMPFAVGDLLMFVDDDDTLTADALSSIRSAAAKDPDRPLMFRLRCDEPDLLIWKEPVVQCGNVGSGCFVVPNRPDRLARWPDQSHPEADWGDYVFIKETLALWPPDALVWREEVIYHVIRRSYNDRPHCENL